MVAERHVALARPFLEPAHIVADELAGVLVVADEAVMAVDDTGAARWCSGRCGRGPRSVFTRWRGSTGKPPMRPLLCGDGELVR